MIVKLEDRKALIAIASEYMNKYSINEFEALKMAENDVEKQREKIDFLNKDGISLG